MTKRLLVLLLLFLLPAPAFAADGSSAAAPSGAGAGRWVSIVSKVDNTAPYQDQPVLLTVTCVIRTNVSNASLDTFTVDNAIVEQSGMPAVNDHVENGATIRVIELRYVVTPLQPGKITIPPVVLQGTVDPLRGNVTPAAGLLQGTESYQPFSVGSSRIVLDVKPPAAAMTPWLPLTSLKITEDFDLSQPVHVGEPVTRRLTLSADGLVGSQLPNLEAQQDHANFRIYADKATTGEDIDNKTGAISGWRKESYSLVPQRAGPLVLPAIRVSWWDIINKKAATAELPERVVNALPAISAPAAPVGYSLLYGLIGVLVFVLLVAAFWAVSLQRKINRLKAHDGPPAAPRQKKTMLRAADGPFENIRTPEELKAFLQTYAHNRWGVSKNASLEKIFSGLPRRRTPQEKEDIEAVINGLTAALYAGRTVDMEDLKNRCRRVIAAAKGGANDNRKGGEILPGLNPS